MGDLDPIAKTLLREAPADFARLALGQQAPIRSVHSVSSELQLLERRVDRLLRVELAGQEPCFVHYEVQASWRSDVPKRVFDYWGLLSREFPVTRSLVLCLQPGNKQGAPKDYYEVSVLGRRVLRFDFDVVCAWRDLEATQLLSGGALGLLPLLPFSGGCDEIAVERGLRALAREPDERRRREFRIALAACANRVFPAGRWLDRITTEELMESTTWRDILQEERAKAIAEGELSGSRRTLSELLSSRLGERADRWRAELGAANAETLKQVTALLAGQLDDAALSEALDRLLFAEEKR